MTFCSNLEGTFAEMGQISISYGRSTVVDVKLAGGVKTHNKSHEALCEAFGTSLIKHGRGQRDAAWISI